MGETLLGLLTYSAGFQICHRHFCWCINAELLFLAGSDGVKGDKTVNVFAMMLMSLFILHILICGILIVISIF